MPLFKTMTTRALGKLLASDADWDDRVSFIRLGPIIILWDAK